MGVLLCYVNFIQSTILKFVLEPKILHKKQHNKATGNEFLTNSICSQQNLPCGNERRDKFHVCWLLLEAVKLMNALINGQCRL